MKTICIGYANGNIEYIPRGVYWWRVNDGYAYHFIGETLGLDGIE